MKLSPSHTKTWEQDGHALLATISPCSWMYPHYGLQVQIGFPDDRSNGGCVFRNLKGKGFETLAVADFDALVEPPVAFVPCTKPGCKGLRIVDNTQEPPSELDRRLDAERRPLCEPCYMQQLTAWFKAEAAKAEAEEKAEDRKRVKQGYTHKVTAWVHPAKGGDDYMLTMYAKAKMTAASVHKHLRDEGSCVLNDWTQVALTQSKPKKGK